MVMVRFQMGLIITCITSTTASSIALSVLQPQSWSHCHNLRAEVFFRKALSFEKAISMGLKSGL